MSHPGLPEHRLAGVSREHLEQARGLGKQTADAVGDDLLDLRRREAQPGGDIGPRRDRQRAGHVITVALAVLDRMGRGGVMRWPSLSNSKPASRLGFFTRRPPPRSTAFSARRSCTVSHSAGSKSCPAGQHRRDRHERNRRLDRRARRRPQLRAPRRVDTADLRRPSAAAAREQPRNCAPSKRSSSATTRSRKR